MLTDLPQLVLYIYISHWEKKKKSNLLMHVVQAFLISLGAYPPCCLTGRRNQIRMFWGPLVPAVTVPPLEGHVIPSLWELCRFFILSCLYYYYYI